MTIGARGLFFAFCRGLGFTRRLIWFRFNNGFIQLLSGFLQRQTGSGAIHRLAGKFRQIHFDISRDNHQIRLLNLFRSDGITRTHGAASFNFHPPAAFFGFGFNRFRRHKGVRDAGRAGSDRHNAFRTMSCRR